MRLPKLIFAQILVKPGLNGWKAATPLAPISESPISANLGWKILYSPPKGGGGGGSTPDFKWKVWSSKDLFGFEQERKRLDFSRDCLGYSKQSEDSWYLWLGNLAWDIWGVKFWSRDFFSGFDFCRHSIIPLTWNPEYPSWVFTFLCIASSNILWYHHWILE